MSEKPRKRIGFASHYSYLGGGGIIRQVQKLFNLTDVGATQRRQLIGNLIKRDGELLATLPKDFKVNCDLDLLEQYLKAGLR